MYFGIKSACNNCPFRTDVPAYLRLSRVETLLQEVLDEEKTFPCHKTTDLPKNRWTMCAGSLLLIERDNEQYNKSHWRLRFAQGLGLYDPSQLDRSAPVHASRQAMLDFFRMGNI